MVHRGGRPNRGNLALEAGRAGEVEIDRFRIGFRSTSWRDANRGNLPVEAGRAEEVEINRFRIGFHSTSWRGFKSRKSGPGGREGRGGGN